MLPGRLQVRRQAADARAALAQIGEADDGLDQVGVGGQLQRVDAGLGQRLAQFGFALGGDAGEALAKAGRACRPHLLAGLGVAQRQQAQVGQLSSSGSSTRTAITSWRCTSWPSGAPSRAR
jgi:hypothetical protein